MPADLREAKPEGFQTQGFPTFFGKGPDCVADSGLFLVGALNRPRKIKLRDESGKSPDHPRADWENPEKIGKVPKKDKKGRTSPDRETPPV